MKEIAVISPMADGKFAMFGNRVRGIARGHFDWIVLGGLGIVVFGLYSSILATYFISDDFSFLSYLHFYTRDILNGQRWGEWFIGGIQGYIFFRPLANLFWVLDYVAFAVNPFGYHVVSVLLHWLACFIVYLLIDVLTRHRIAAASAALVFAIMPVHVEAVSWVAAIYDPISALFFFSSFLFFVLCIRQGKRQLYGLAFVTFAAALCSKEIALTFPGIILLYEVMFNRFGSLQIRSLVARHAPFWILVAIRLILFGHGHTGLQFNEFDWWSWLDGLLLRASNPWVTEMGIETRTILLLGAALVILIYRARPEIAYGAFWIPLTYVPTVVGEVSDRSFYISSFGLALMLAGVLASLGARSGKRLTAAGAILLLVMAFYTNALVSTNQTMRHAGDVAESILRQLVALHPTWSPGERLVFVGVPDRVPEGTLVFLTGFAPALSIQYGTREIAPLRFAKFPIWRDDLDKTFFFEVDHRRLVERSDLIEALKERARCASHSAPFLTWKFSEGSLDWEAWSQLSDFAIRDGTLAMHSNGDDPIMASPPIDIPTIAIGAIEVTIRVRAAESIQQGEWYWLASGQDDFSPGLKESFQVTADGNWHTYRVEIGQSGPLFLGDRITRLRLDPVGAPAEIAIQSIKVFSHCDSVQEARCLCAR